MWQDRSQGGLGGEALFASRTSPAPLQRLVKSLPARHCPAWSVYLVEEAAFHDRVSRERRRAGQRVTVRAGRFPSLAFLFPGPATGARYDQQRAIV